MALDQLLKLGGDQQAQVPGRYNVLERWHEHGEDGAEVVDVFGLCGDQLVDDHVASPWGREIKHVVITCNGSSLCWTWLLLELVVRGGGRWAIGHNNTTTMPKCMKPDFCTITRMTLVPCSCLDAAHVKPKLLFSKLSGFLKGEEPDKL